MKARLAALVVTALSAATPSLQAASSHVSRCASSDGSTVYTDGSCRAIGAQAVPMSAELVRNLVREGGIRSEPLAATTSTPVRDWSGKRNRPAMTDCSRTPAQLAGALRASLAGGDVNELAAIYDWTGMSGQQAKPVLQRLERMSDRPLIDGRFYDASISQSVDGDAGEGGFVQLVQGASAAPMVTELAVKRRAGCLLLAF